jgi:hypothetical protein
VLIIVIALDSALAAYGVDTNTLNSAVSLIIPWVATVPIPSPHSTGGHLAQRVDGRNRMGLPRRPHIIPCHL